MLADAYLQHACNRKVHSTAPESCLASGPLMHLERTHARHVPQQDLDVPIGWAGGPRCRGWSAGCSRMGRIRAWPSWRRGPLQSPGPGRQSPANKLARSRQLPSGDQTMQQHRRLPAKTLTRLYKAGCTCCSQSSTKTKVAE